MYIPIYAEYTLLEWETPASGTLKTLHAYTAPRAICMRNPAAAIPQRFEFDMNYLRGCVVNCA